MDPSTQCLLLMRLLESPPDTPLITMKLPDSLIVFFRNYLNKQGNNSTCVTVPRGRSVLDVNSPE